MEGLDNVIPASNSEKARNLFVLGHYYSDDSWIERSSQMLANLQEDLHRNIYYVCRDKVCRLPVIRAEEALEQLRH